MYELDRHADTLGAVLLAHQARAVCRDDVFGASPGVINGARNFRALTQFRSFV